MMKKTLSILFLGLSGIAAATPAALPNYPIIYSAEVGGPVPNPAYQTPDKPAQAAEPEKDLPRYRDPSCYTFGVNLLYGMNAAPSSKFACDVVGFELDGAFYFAPRQAITLTLGFSGGGETNDFWVMHDRFFLPFTDSFDRNSFTLTSGYRFTLPLGKSVVLTLGAKCGMDVQTLNVDHGFGWNEDAFGNHRRGKSSTSVGMAYAGYIGLGFYLTPKVHLNIGYQYAGSTAKPSVTAGQPFMTQKYSTRTMRWHEITAGLTFRF